MSQQSKASKASIPPVSYEPGELTEQLGYSRRINLASRGKFQACIPAILGNLPITIDPELLGEIEDASTALARFDSSAQGFAGPLVAILLRTESSASSQVERVFAGGREFGLAQLGISKSASAQLVVDNTTAMKAALGLSEKVSAENLIQMHRALLERSNPRIVGSFREVPVWIGGPTPHLAKFVGPLPSRIPAAIEDLAVFTRRIDIPRLAQVAIAHAQFETIHPFEDGNGRTGRALVHALLKSNGLTQNSTVPISAGLVSNLEGYFSSLTAFREGDAAPIIEAFVSASLFGISVANSLIAQIREAEAKARSMLSARSDSVAMRVLPHLAEYPALSAKKVQELLQVSTPSAIAGLVALKDAGVLEQNSAQRRNRVWIAPDYIKIWENFSDIEFGLKTGAFS